MADITYCDMTHCPFKDCDRHCSNAPQDKPVSTGYIAGECKRYWKYVEEQVYG